MKAQTARYQLLRKLAVGGMAEIYLSKRISFGEFSQLAVIKRLLPEHQGRAAYERLFSNEARLTALLKHPQVIQVHDFGKLDGAYFIAMEYVHGVSGAEFMAQASRSKIPIPLEVALFIVVQVAEALHYCYSGRGQAGEPLGIIHHDVSPQNIQLGYEAEVKLLDFGVATRDQEEALKGRRGKFAYMSPEAIEKQPLDQRSDLYSLGVILFELSLGRRLFKGSNTAETLKRASRGMIPRPSSLKADYPPALERVLFKALARDPDERYETGAAFAQALRGLTKELNLRLEMGSMVEFMSRLYAEKIQHRLNELAELLKGGAPLLPLPLPEDKTQTPSLSLEFEFELEPEIKSVARTPELEIDSLEIPEELQFEALVHALGRWRRRSLLALLLALSLGALGFLLGREREPLRFKLESEPSEVRVYDGEQLLGMTPFTLPRQATPYHLSLRRGGSLELKLRLETQASQQHIWIELSPQEIDGGSTDISLEDPVDASLEGSIDASLEGSGSD